MDAGGNGTLAGPGRTPANPNAKGGCTDRAGEVAGREAAGGVRIGNSRGAAVVPLPGGSGDGVGRWTPEAARCAVAASSAALWNFVNVSRTACATNCRTARS